MPLFTDSFAEIVLNGGETSTLQFKHVIKPKENFCLRVIYRSGPAVEGQSSNNKAIITFEIPNSPPVVMDLPDMPVKLMFSTNEISIAWNYNTKVSSSFL